MYALLETSQGVLLEHLTSLYELFRQKKDVFSSRFFSVGVYRHLSSSIIEYYNLAHRSLTLKNDPEWSERITELNEMAGQFRHNETCLLNVLFQLTMFFLHAVMEGHHRLVATGEFPSLDQYLARVTELITKRDFRVDILVETLAHNTGGVGEPQPCPTTTPLFRVPDAKS